MARWRNPWRAGILAVVEEKSRPESSSPEANAASEARPEERVMAPREVCGRLGISPAGLRRLAPVYERVHGPLPRDDRGRLWPLASVEEMEKARSAVHAGRYVSVEQALRAAQGGGEGEGGVDAPTAPRRGFYGDTGPAEAILEELRGLRSAVEENNTRLAAMEEENRRLRAALPVVPPQAEDDDVAGEQRGAEEEVEQSRDAPPASPQEPREGGLLRRVRRWMLRGDTRP